MLVPRSALQDYPRLDAPSKLELRVEQLGHSEGKAVRVRLLLCNQGPAHVFISRNIVLGGHLRISFTTKDGSTVPYRGDDLPARKDSLDRKREFISLHSGMVYGLELSFTLQAQALGLRMQGSYRYDLPIELPARRSDDDQPAAIAFRGTLKSGVIVIR